MWPGCEPWLQGGATQCNGPVESEQWNREGQSSSQGWRQPAQDDGHGWPDKLEGQRSSKDKLEGQRSSKDKLEVQRSPKDKLERQRSPKDKLERQRSQKDKPEFFSAWLAPRLGVIVSVMKLLWAVSIIIKGFDIPIMVVAFPLCVTCKRKKNKCNLYPKGFMHY